MVDFSRYRCDLVEKSWRNLQNFLHKEPNVGYVLDYVKLNECSSFLLKNTISEYIINKYYNSKTKGTKLLEDSCFESNEDFINALDIVRSEVGIINSSKYIV